MSDLVFEWTHVAALGIGYGALLLALIAFALWAVEVSIKREYVLFTLFGFGFSVFDMNRCRRLVDNMIRANYTPIWKFQRFAFGLCVPNRIRQVAFWLFPSLKQRPQPLDFD